MFRLLPNLQVLRKPHANRREDAQFKSRAPDDPVSVRLLDTVTGGRGVARDEGRAVGHSDEQISKFHRGVDGVRDEEMFVSH